MNARWISTARAVSSLATASASADLVRQRGFAFPLRAKRPDEADEMLLRLWAYGRGCEGGLSGDARFKTHLLLPWVADLVRCPEVLDPLKLLLGPNILIWSSGWAIKAARSSGFYSWHQDSTYARLTPDDSAVVAWFALTPTSRENGCVRYIPGSHHRQLSHNDSFEDDNLLSRGQHVRSDDIDEDTAVDGVLEPGQVALHHFRCVHGSGANSESSARVGLQVIYMATHCRKSNAEDVKESASLVSGSDDFGHWELEEWPREDCGAREIRQHRRAMELEKLNYFSDSRGRQGYHR